MDSKDVEQIISNIEFWRSIAQIFTSLILVVAAVWTVRIHHKNRQDIKRKENKNLAFRLYKSYRSLLDPDFSIHKGVLFEVFASNNSLNSYQILESNLNIGFEQGRTDLPLNSITKISKSNIRPNDISEIKIFIEYLVLAKSIMKDKSTLKIALSDSYYTVSVLFLDPSNQIKEVKCDVTQTCRSYLLSFQNNERGTDESTLNLELT